jgi:CBS domain-containing protein
VTAGEIMETNVPFVLQHATPKEVASLLSKNKDANVFPVVNSKGKAYLLSVVRQLVALMELTSIY